MSKEMYRKEYDTLISELDHILNSEEIVSELHNENVVLQFLKSIKICEFLEDKLDIPQNERKTASFLKTISNYYAINNIHVDSYYYIDETTLNDDVNYLKIFSKNILKKDYLDLTPRNTTNNSSNKNSSTTNNTKRFDSSKDSSSNKEDTFSSNEPYDYINGMNNYNNGYGNGFFGNLFGGNSFGGNYGASMNSMEDQMAYQAAYSRYSYEVNTGKIYIFDSKPKAIPVLKIITGIFVLLLAVVIIIATALSQSIIYLIIPRDSTLFSTLNSVLNGYLQKQYPSGYVQFYMIPNLPTATGGGWFFAIIFALLFCWEAYIQLKPTLNDNFKYRMRISSILFEVIIVLIFFIWSFNYYSIAHYLFSYWNAFSSTYLNYNGGYYYPLVITTYAFTILYVVLLCSLIVVPLCAWIFQPKRNFEFINSIIQTYYDEAKSQIEGSIRR